MKPTQRATHAAKRIRNRVKPQEVRSRGPATLYLDTALFKTFKKECDAVNMSASMLFEEFMREFLGEK
jgi:hypothetical protein